MDEEIEGVDYVMCQICYRKFKAIVGFHLKTHNITMEEYKKLYPDVQLVSGVILKKVSDSLIQTYKDRPELIKHLSEINSGENHPKFGKKDSDETRQKKSDALTGKPKSDEHKQNISIANTGKTRSDEFKENKAIEMLQFYKDHPEVADAKSQPGENNPNFGNKWTLEQRIALSCKNRDIPIEEFDEFTHIMASEFFTSEDREKWRKEVITRDNNICQECGTKIGVKHVHHILPWRDYPEPEYSLNINNGITLCEKCHRETYGREYDFMPDYLGKIFDDKAAEIWN